MTPNGSTKFYELAASNNQLLISADNGMYGAELFKHQGHFYFNVSATGFGKKLTTLLSSKRILLI